MIGYDFEVASDFAIDSVLLSLIVLINIFGDSRKKGLQIFFF